MQPRRTLRACTVPLLAGALAACHGSRPAMRRRRLPLPGAALAAAGMLLAGCGSDAHGRAVPGGRPDRGKLEIAAYGCDACHVIPGMGGAYGSVGPPLTNSPGACTSLVRVPNTSRFLVQWITVPQSIEPNTAMPSLGVTEGQARDIAAYLYTLR